MTLYVDGKYIFDELLFISLNEQSKVFGTKMRVATYRPINSYVMVFDIMTRMVKKYIEFITLIKRKYKISKVVFVFTQPKSHGLCYYDRYAKRMLYMKSYIYNVSKTIYKYKYLYPELKERDVDKSIEFMMDKLHIDKDYKFDYVKKGENTKTMVPIYLFYVAIYQNYINYDVEKYLMNIIASNPINDIVSKQTNYISVKNCYFISDKTYTSNLSIDYQLKEHGKLGKDEPKNNYIITKNNEGCFIEKRKIKTVCDTEYGNVLYVNDDNVLILLDKGKKIYTNIKQNKIMDMSDYPKSFAKANYTMFKPLFEKINEELNLHLEKFI